MNVFLRTENESDYEVVEYITREAFWDIYKPGCDEHLLAHKLRKVPSFIPSLDYVAVVDGRAVGNIMYSKAVIKDQDIAHEVVTFGPISVLPEFHKQGIGTALIEHTKKLAAEMGYRAIIIFGDPGYYHRFGFVNAEKYRITTKDGENFEPFMALELYPDALRGIAGSFHEDLVFQIDPEELEVFEKKFPYKEKHVTDTQLKT